MLLALEKLSMHRVVKHSVCIWLLYVQFVYGVYNEHHLVVWELH